ncbi:MAG: hypothetical protein Q4G13_01260 [Moraxella sp.]|nr:hypothetical protein [Moraxella sp.]
MSSYDGIGHESGYRIYEDLEPSKHLLHPNPLACDDNNALFNNMQAVSSIPLVIEILEVRNRANKYRPSPKQNLPP